MCTGKTCENLKKRSDVKLFAGPEAEDRVLHETEKPHCKGFRIFDEELAVVDMKKTIALMDKPFAVGFCVLEWAKVWMYTQHYQLFKEALFGDRCQLLFTDTDSLMYEIESPDMYAELAEYADCFDLSSLPPTNPHHDARNKKVIGKLKGLLPFAWDH
jgi:hypothetical protein